MIRETILYYIVKWYTESWFFRNINLMERLLKSKLSYCNNKAKALELINKKQFKYLSKQYKEQLVHEKFL